MDNTLNKTDNFDWLENFEIESNPLYSNSSVQSVIGGANQSSDETNQSEANQSSNEEDRLFNGLFAPLAELFTFTEESEVPLTKTVTVGNPEGTQFTFNFAEDTPQEVIDGVKQAGSNWSAVLTDDVDLTIDFIFQPIEGGLIGQTRPNFLPLEYSAVKEALVEDSTSSDDQTAVANLPAETVNYLINNTAENNGSDTPYLDDNNGSNNSLINMTRANAKALGFEAEELAIAFGLTPEDGANLPDANIAFNNEVNWDYDRSNGIAADAYDFVGTVEHELGHALGFWSNADVLNSVSNTKIGGVIEGLATEGIQELVANSGLKSVADSISADRLFSENEYLPTTLDLFRFTPESFVQDARDFTASNIDGKYFSIDGGETEIAAMTEVLGLSHWQEGLGIGLMDSSFELGDKTEISDTDLLAFDAIGWDVV